MTFYQTLAQVIELLERERRVTYRALKRQFQLDDEYLEDLKAELVQAKRLARDEDGVVLVWIGGETAPLERPEPPRPAAARGADPPSESPLHEAERRQLTVLFCDLVDSTGLSRQLDPEDLREVVRAYQDTCAKVINRFEGHIAQYLGDGLLVYFGYPRAHEDNAQRAVRAGLGMVEAVRQLNGRLSERHGVRLAVRLGIHTGLVVIGGLGSGASHEQLALGESPNIAARLQGLAAPDTLVISDATFHLLGGLFACESLGTPPLRGVGERLEVHRVLHERMARSRIEAAGPAGLIPLIGRDQELATLLALWERVKAGSGQVILLEGEAGIGKSRLVHRLREHVAAEPRAWLTPCQCSPYHRSTALYPMIDVLERVALRFEREESPQQKLAKLEGFLVQYGVPLPEIVPLFATLLSVPLTPEYASAPGPPEQQRQQLLQALVTITLRIAAQEPVLFLMEDLHWVDPTTLEFLALLVDQAPGARILALLTFRPDFSPPWGDRPHASRLVLGRLPQPEIEEMIRLVGRGKVLPAEVVEQIVARTDGVPLFVEELTKMVLESGLLRSDGERYELSGALPPLAIPTTLHDSLMARLDRLATVKGLAQFGATLGRRFSYDLLQAVAPWTEEALRHGLRELVQAEFLYQHGVPPHATYIFKHALIQEAAYESLLRSSRQLYHQRIAETVEARFPEVRETQPELLAHHYTEAGRKAQAVPYWQRAGQRAVERSANAEAVQLLTRALGLLDGLPPTSERARQELELETTLGPALMAARGYGDPEVKRVYARARELCLELDDTARLFPVLMGLGTFHYAHGELRVARELGEQGLALAKRAGDPIHLLEAHLTLGGTLFYLGILESAHTHLEQARALYDPERHRALAFTYGHDPGVACRARSAVVQWLLGYPDRSLRELDDALALSREIAHPFSLAFALYYAGWIHHFRREEDAVHRYADALVRLCTEHRFAVFLPAGTIQLGWALAELGERAEGMRQIRAGLAAWRGTGAELVRPYWLSLLTEVCALDGQVEEGLERLREAGTAVGKNGESWWEAELSRLEGELWRRRSEPDEGRAEACFRRALDIGRRQEGRSVQLRAATSLGLLLRQQGRRGEARELLAGAYGFFTEGFETADLRDARALLDDLA